MVSSRGSDTANLPLVYPLFDRGEANAKLHVVEVGASWPFGTESYSRKANSVKPAVPLLSPTNYPANRPYSH